MKPCLALATALALATGCSKTNSNYCASAPDHNCTEATDAHGSGSADSAVGCGSAADCAGTATPVCDDKHVCVQCDSSDKTACMGPTPSCDTSADTCRACATHADCGSPGVCLPDGSCGADANTAWVAPTGSGNACTQAAPCATITAALATNRPYIKVAAGTISDQPTISRDVTILAESNSKISGMVGPVVTVTGSSTVDIHDLAITGGFGTTGHGIYVSGIDTPTLTLKRVTVSGNDGQGISIGGGSIVADRCAVATNQLGGLSLHVSTFAITNTFITRNGNASTGVSGGASLAATDPAHSSFEFNTVVDNNTPSTTTLSAGVYCDIASFSAPNNILARNLINGNAGASNANHNGQCTFPTSTIEATVTDLSFSSPDSSPYNYHLASGSVAIDQATTASTVDIDVDGDHRPQGSQKDQGADEFK